MHEELLEALMTDGEIDPEKVAYLCSASGKPVTIRMEYDDEYCGCVLNCKPLDNEEGGVDMTFTFCDDHAPSGKELLGG